MKHVYSGGSNGASGCFMLGVFLFIVAFWAMVGVVAWHFLAKWW